MSTNVNQKTGLMTVIEQSSPVQLPAIPEIADRFKRLYAIIHPGAKAEIFYEAEKFHFMKLIKESESLQSCSKMSLYGCFMDVAVNGLSFDPSFKHLYIVPYNVNIGTKQNPKWEKRASLQISGYGELVLRQKQGQVKYAENPVLVYQGDDFSFGTKDEKFFINHTANLAKRNDVIIACYLKIVRHDGSSDYKVITSDDMERFRKFSKDGNSKAWTDGIAGMWVAKCIKHSFKNYPKVRTGDFSQLASHQVDEEAEVVSSVVGAEMQIPESVDYGLEENNKQEAPASDDSFVGNGKAAGNTVVHSDDDF